MNSLVVPKFNKNEESKVNLTQQKVFINGKYETYLAFELIEEKKVL